MPTFWDGDLTLWESGTIVEYLLATYPQRPAGDPPLAAHAFRPEAEWQDKLTFATIQTFGNAATIISQMKWAGVGVDDNAHLQRSAEKLSHILGWLESRLLDTGNGFLPGCLSMQDIFLAAHVRFVGCDQYEKITSLLNRLDERDSFKANPIWWWEPGVLGYQPDGTPVFSDGTRRT